MTQKLDRIRVNGYKSIREMDLELKALNVLIGANGAGKTNFISLFALLRQIVEKNLQLHVARLGGANTFLYFGQQVTSEIVIYLAFGPNAYSCSLIPVVENTLIFGEEQCWLQDQKQQTSYIRSLGKGHRETLLYEASHNGVETDIVSNVLAAMRSWRVYHFHDTSATSKIKQMGDINDNAILHPDASNLAAFLYLLRQNHPLHYKKVVSTIQLVAPFFNDFVLRPNPFNENKIQLEWQEKGADSYFNAHYLSDGTLRFICLATLLLQPNLPSTILIDEPELGLHPYAITLLAGLLKSASTQTQVIVSTQSVPLVNQFEPGDIIVVDREDNQSIFKRLAEAELTGWLDEYGLGDLWEKNLLGGRPR
jgi:predicted ATPase